MSVYRSILFDDNDVCDAVCNLLNMNSKISIIQIKRYHHNMSEDADIEVLTRFDGSLYLEKKYMRSIGVCISNRDRGCTDIINNEEIRYYLGWVTLYNQCLDENEKVGLNFQLDECDNIYRRIKIQDDDFLRALTDMVNDNSLIDIIKIEKNLDNRDYKFSVVTRFNGDEYLEKKFMQKATIEIPTTEIYYGLETIDNKRVLVRHGRLRYEKSDMFKNRISRN